jgi:hypothetical protein
MQTSALGRMCLQDSCGLKTVADGSTGPAGTGRTSDWSDQPEPGHYVILVRRTLMNILMAVVKERTVVHTKDRILHTD